MLDEEEKDGFIVEGRAEGCLNEIDMRPNKEARECLDQSEVSTSSA